MPSETTGMATDQGDELLRRRGLQIGLQPHGLTSHYDALYTNNHGHHVLLLPHRTLHHGSGRTGGRRLVSLKATYFVQTHMRAATSSTPPFLNWDLGLGLLPSQLPRQARISRGVTRIEGSSLPPLHPTGGLQPSCCHARLGGCAQGHTTPSEAPEALRPSSSRPGPLIETTQGGPSEHDPWLPGVQFSPPTSSA